MPPEQNGAVVTLEEMYRDIKELRRSVAELVVLANTSQDHEARIRDLEKNVASAADVAKHEDRLDAIDRKHWYASGALLVLGILAPNLGEIQKLFGG
ncbi:hypothetical protein [Saccharopolyspora pogona]|uniref:hypothetical protein n=1 Tax=Saccharopolyspora pogona TaxID=333966 RepID=UPI0016861AE5|nr:hypothetical protein [Saccharopolyspora pogona]